MPAHPFTVHVDPDELARLDLAAAVSGPSRTGRPAAGAAHRGAGDGRPADRQKSGPGRVAATGRSYAFRRS